MRRSLIAALCGLAIAAGCDSIDDIADTASDWFFQDEENCDCGNHYLLLNEGEIPDDGEVVVRISDGYGNVDIQIYEGTMQNGKRIKDTASGNQRNTFLIPVNKEYTYVARYLKGQDTILVPVKTKLGCKVNECKGLQCYFLENNVIDLSLKF